MTFEEAKKALALKLNLDYSDIVNNDVFSDSDLGELINAAVKTAWNYHPWPFTQGAKTTTSVDSAYYDYPADFESESIYLLRVDGEEFSPKLDFTDYQKHLEDTPTSTDTVWSEYKRFYFINQNAYTIGDTIEVYGKLRVPKLSSASDLLPFSPDSDDSESGGNWAIVLIAYGEALSSEKKKNPTQGDAEIKKGLALLDIEWQPYKQKKANKQTERAFFDVPNYF